MPPGAGPCDSGMFGGIMGCCGIPPPAGWAVALPGGIAPGPASGRGPFGVISAGPAGVIITWPTPPGITGPAHGGQAMPGIPGMPGCCGGRCWYGLGASIAGVFGA